MKFTKCSATNVAVSVALLMAGLVGLPATAEDPAQEFEQLKEIEPPEGYVLYDVKECPEGTRALASAMPDPREEDTVFWTEDRRVLLVLDEEGEPELEIGPETFDLEILKGYELNTASWLGDGESFVFVAYPSWRRESELAEQHEILETLAPMGRDHERFRELNDRLNEVGHDIHGHLRDLLEMPALFRCDAATGEIEQLWDIGQQVRNLDLDREGLIHVALRDNHVHVLTPEGEHVTSHAIPGVPEGSNNLHRLDASSHTIWTTMVMSEDEVSGRFIVRLHYGGEEPGEWMVVVEDAFLVDASGSALLYVTDYLHHDEGEEILFVYDVETGEHTRVLQQMDFVEDFSSGEVEPSLAHDGAAARYKVLDLESDMRYLRVERWENTALYEYTLPE